MVWEGDFLSAGLMLWTLMLEHSVFGYAPQQHRVMPKGGLDERDGGTAGAWLRGVWGGDGERWERGGVERWGVGLDIYVRRGGQTNILTI